MVYDAYALSPEMSSPPERLVSIHFLAERKKLFRPASFLNLSNSRGLKSGLQRRFEYPTSPLPPLRGRVRVGGKQGATLQVAHSPTPQPPPVKGGGGSMQILNRTTITKSDHFPGVRNMVARLAKRRPAARMNGWRFTVHKRKALRCRGLGRVWGFASHDSGVVMASELSCSRFFTSASKSLT
jgi:hypothetical protein